MKTIDSRITIPESICGDEIVGYIASRYAISPQQVISQFMCQEGIMSDRQADADKVIVFEENEMAIIQDMGIRPMSN